MELFLRIEAIGAVSAPTLAAVAALDMVKFGKHPFAAFAVIVPTFRERSAGWG
jgi:uncharacterized protein (UPF0261 family)